MKLFLVLATIGTLAAQTLPVAVPLDDHSNSTQTRPFAVVANAAALPTLGCVPNSYAVTADTNVLYHNTATGSCSWAVVVTGASSSGSATAVQTANGSGGFSDGGCTMTGSVLTCGTNMYFGGVCVAPGTIATPSAGSVNYFCDSTNSNHLSAMTSSGPPAVDLQSGDASKINGTSLAGLATGLLKNTTGTGVPSIATPGTDYGLGTVTTVGFTGGLLSIANPTTTPAITVAGNSGGIPYFDSASTWATSAAMTAHGVMIGGGAATAPTSTAAGTAGQVLVSGGSGADPTYKAGMVLINEQVLAGAVATVTFSSIPSTYRNLQVVVSGRCSAASNYQDVYMQFNADTGANYSRETVLGQATTASAAQNTSSANAPIGGMACATSDTDAPGMTTITIPNYTGTTFDKVATSMSGAMNGALSTWLVESTAFHWNSTAAITSIVLGVVGGSNFNIGSVFSLYGF